MMKIICLVVIAIAVERSYAKPEEIGKILAECKTLEKVSDADVMNFQNKVKSDTKEAKCLATCVMEKVQIIRDNQINPDGIIELAKMMPNANEKTLQSASEVANECKPIKEADRCENGAKIAACLMEAAAKRQLGGMFM